MNLAEDGYHFFPGGWRETFPFLFNEIAKHLYTSNDESHVTGIHETAIIGKGVKLDPQYVSVGPYVVIGSDTEIGDGTKLSAGVRIGNNISIGKKLSLEIMFAPALVKGFKILPSCNQGDLVLLCWGLLITLHILLILVGDDLQLVFTFLLFFKQSVQFEIGFKLLLAQPETTFNPAKRPICKNFLLPKREKFI